ncbi:MAG TPA: PAS domain S-box protein [Rubrobacter sp.]|nr:PAS domain S-box protein [Rubrobacter sp.]
MVRLPHRKKRTDLKPLRVLIVEDSENDALLLVRELKRGGYEPDYERVYIPEAMEEALDTSEWDVIVSDYRMPRFGALDALAMAQEASFEGPFIVVSGKVGEAAAVGVMKSGAYDFLTKDNLALLIPMVERGLEETRERRRRDAILEAVRFAAERFLGETTSWQDNVRAVLRRLGEAAEVSRAYIFENYRGADGEIWATQPYEWVAPGVSAQIENPLLIAFPYRSAGFGRWIEMLGQGELVYGHTRDFPESEQPQLRGQDILSIVVVPIFVEELWWGFVGFDECIAEREWSPAEMDTLKAAASTLGAAVRRRRAEDALRESEERYSLVVEASNDGIFDWDIPTGELYWNDRLYEMLALPRLEVSPTFELFVKLLHPDDRQRVLDAITAHLERGVKYSENFRLRRSSGDFIYCIGRGIAQRDDKGTSIRMVGSVSDVTERTKAEEALSQSQERYRAVIEQATDGIYLLDAQTRRILQTNPSFERMLGYAADELLGMEVYDFVAHPREDVDSVIRRTLKQRRRLVGGRQYLRKDGSLLDVEVGVSVISIGGKAVICTIVRDVTERKKAEEKVRSSEAELRAVFEAIADAIFVYDSEGRYLKVAPSNPSLLYRPAEEMLGKTLHEVLPKEPADQLLGQIRRALETRQSASLEYGLRIGDEHLWFEATISPMTDDSVVAVARDVTERKIAEEALRQSERLYRTVIEQVTENICLVDVETRDIVGSNPAFRETLGYNEEELEQMTLYDIVAHDQDSVDRNIWLTVEEGRTFVGQRKYRRKDGSLIDVEASGSIIVRHGRETLCVVAHDVTERARMQELLEERVSTLSTIAARVTLDLPMEDMMDTLAEGVVKASTAVACVVASVDESPGVVLRPEGAFGLPEGSKTGLEASWRAGARSPTIEAFRTQQSVLVPNTREFLLGNEIYVPIHHFVREAAWDTAYIVPLISRGRSLGTLTLLYLPGQEPGEEERVFLKAVADQTAVAIENARLFSEARGKAALEERQRLARELHDSVSQALYGIALGTKTAHALVKQDPDRASEPLEYVLSLAEAGMAEMRALIFELRPESLEREGLVTALEKQAAALRARHKSEVETDLCTEPDVPLDVKEALYRIAQEALHNTVKHARASSVKIRMLCSSEYITLDISDDGIGFETKGDFPGHLGLRSMRERAERLGGTLAVESTPGKGTRVRTWMPV